MASGTGIKKNYQGRALAALGLILCLWTGSAVAAGNRVCTDPRCLVAIPPSFLWRLQYTWPDMKCGFENMTQPTARFSHFFANPGTLVANLSADLEEEAAIEFVWQCDSANYFPPAIGFTSSTNNVVLPITNSTSIKGSASVRGKVNVLLFNNVLPQHFAQSDNTCPCELGYKIVRKSTSSNGIETILNRAQTYQAKVQLKISQYDLQKKVLTLMSESNERLNEIRQNLNPQDPFEAILIQKIDEILNGQDLGISPETLAALKSGLESDTNQLLMLRARLAAALDLATGDLAANIVAATAALDKVLDQAGSRITAS